MLIIMYKCPHCDKLFENKDEYRGHVLKVMGDCADTLNSFVSDLKELNLSIYVSQSPFTNRPYVEVKNNVDQSN